MSDAFSTDLETIKKGAPPVSDDLLRSLSTGLEPLTGFLKDQYLADYIARGGSKLKFITGRAGSGKTHLTRLLEADARQLNYIPVRFSARSVWLHDFREIYLEILRQCDLEHILKGCAEQIIRSMGADPAAFGEGKTFTDHLSEEGKWDALSRSAIREELRERFVKNPLLDNNFAICCSLLTGDLLGHPVLDAQSREVLHGYLHGDKTVKFAAMRSLGLTPVRITKYNARHMLRSLAEVVHLSGYAGILVTIDDLEVLLRHSGMETMRYTKLRRWDTYESIRQLIDDIDNMRYILFCFAFDRELMEDESYGFKSYQALWMRIQNEVTGFRFNRFADILDLDRYADQFYTQDVLIEMSEKLAAFATKNHLCASPVDEEKAAQLTDQSHFGGIGLPYLVNHAVFEEPDTVQKSEGVKQYD